MNFKIILRSSFKKKQNNIIRVLSLGIGLTMGLVLIAKVFFELSYDNFYPDSERIYMIQSNYVMPGETEPMQAGQVSGGVAVGMKAEIPQVEAATRFSNINYGGATNEPITLSDKRRITVGNFILADSYIFDILPRPMIVGNYKETLANPMHVLVSRSFAEKIGNINNVVGQSFSIDRLPNRNWIIGGIFEDVPENSTIEYDAIISISSTTSIFGGDGTENWVGNDIYRGFVKLQAGTNPLDLKSSTHAMAEKYLPIEQLKEMGVQISYDLMPLTKIKSDMPETKRMTLLLSLLAFAVIFTAVMNYILIVISSLVSRTKEVAVQKCYGAGEKDITKNMLLETLIYLIVSIAVAVFLIFLFQPIVEELLSTSLNALFSLRSALLLLLVCAVVFLITGIVPAKIYSNIPVSSAFRNNKESRRKWKLGLLFFQFAAATFLVILLVIIGRQYDYMINDNPGYEYKNVLYSKIEGVSITERQRLIEELKRLPEVQMVATSYQLPMFGGSGNNVILPEIDEALFNMADLYSIDSDYLSLMEIPIIMGEGFSRGKSESSHMLVSQSFAELVIQNAGWDDGIIGKTLQITEHGSCTVVGIYPNIRVSSINNTDDRPSAMFYSDAPSRHILVKLNTMTPENIQKVSNVFTNAFPDRDIMVTPYSMGMAKLYDSSRLFRNSVMIGGIITLLITLIGLIGYVNDEVNRRSSEVAIRKVNGASVRELQQLFVVNIVWIAIPALIIGAIASYFTAVKWMENFSEKTNLSAFLFMGCAILVLFVVTIVVYINTYRIAIKNPVDTLKN